LSYKYEGKTGSSATKPEVKPLILSSDSKKKTPQKTPPKNNPEKKKKETKTPTAYKLSSRRISKNG